MALDMARHKAAMLSSINMSFYFLGDETRNVSSYLTLIGYSKFETYLNYD